MKKYKVFIVDDHQMFRDGLNFLLSKKEQFEVMGEASNGKEFIDIIMEGSRPDIVLMDISMPEMNGIEATKKVLKILPGLKILALSMFGEEDYYYKMIHAGVKGFILKESGSTDLDQGLSTVLEGGNYFSPGLLKNVIPKIGAETKITHSKETNYDLSEDERLVLTHTCAGMSSSEISKREKLDFDNVEQIINKLMDLSSVSTPIDLIMFAIKNKLIEY